MRRPKAGMIDPRPLGEYQEGRPTTNDPQGPLDRSAVESISIDRNRIVRADPVFEDRDFEQLPFREVVDLTRHGRSGEKWIEIRLVVRDENQTSHPRDRFSPLDPQTSKEAGEESDKDLMEAIAEADPRRDPVGPGIENA